MSTLTADPFEAVAELDRTRRKIETLDGLGAPAQPTNAFDEAAAAADRVLEATERFIDETQSIHESAAKRLSTLSRQLEHAERADLTTVASQHTSAIGAAEARARDRARAEADRRLAKRRGLWTHLILIGLPLVIGWGASFAVSGLNLTENANQDSVYLFFGAIAWAFVAAWLYRWVRPKRAKSVASRDTEGRSELILAADRPLLALGCCVAAAVVAPIAVSGACVVAALGAIALVIFFIIN